MTHTLKDKLKTIMEVNDVMLPEMNETLVRRITKIISSLADSINEKSKMNGHKTKFITAVPLQYTIDGDMVGDDDGERHRVQWEEASLILKVDFKKYFMKRKNRVQADHIRDATKDFLKKFEQIIIANLPNSTKVDYSHAVIELDAATDMIINYSDSDIPQKLDRNHTNHIGSSIITMTFSFVPKGVMRERENGLKAKEEIRDY